MLLLNAGAVYFVKSVALDLTCFEMLAASCDFCNISSSVVIRSAGTASSVRNPSAKAGRSGVRIVYCAPSLGKAILSAYCNYSGEESVDGVAVKRVESVALCFKM